MNMWSIEISRQTTAKKEQLWNLWADVANWNSWDSTVVNSELYGNFNVGTKGMVKLNLQRGKHIPACEI